MTPGPRKATDPAREAPLPPPYYPENPSPWARLGRWLFDRLTRR
jgi:hypothetical protein